MLPVQGEADGVGSKWPAVRDCLGHTRQVDRDADDWWQVDVVLRRASSTEMQAAAIVEAVRMAVDPLFRPTDARAFRGVRETFSYDIAPPDGSLGVSFWVSAASAASAVDQAVNLVEQACRQVLPQGLPLWDVRALPLAAVLSREEAGAANRRVLRSSRGSARTACSPMLRSREIDTASASGVELAIVSRSATGVRPQVRRLRREIADRFEELPPEAWDAPSWCSGWRTRDVLGHLVYNAEATGFSVARDVIRYFGRADRAMSRVAQRLGKEPVPSLVERLRAAEDGHHRVPGLPPAVGLGDLLVHNCDMFRPLGIDMEAGEEDVRLALDAYQRVGRLVVHAAPHRRVTLVAIDLDWRTGRGPEVMGKGIDVLLLMANRTQVIGALEGPGLSLIGGSGSRWPSG
jgi:uncharacterized protein (TIGR03083 family)